MENAELAWGQGVNINPQGLTYRLITKLEPQVSWQPKQKEKGDELCDSCYLQGDYFSRFPFGAWSSSKGSASCPYLPRDYVGTCVPWPVVGLGPVFAV